MSSHTLPVLVGTIAFWCASSLCAQDLNPPPGPVTGTMVSLDRIEPRVIISDLPGSATALHAITQPGTYVLTESVTGQAGLNGIEITPASDGDFIIELNGFQLNGVPGSLDAVRAARGTGEGRIVIRGISPAIHGWGGDGVDVANFDLVVVEKMDISGCGGAAVRVSGAPDPNSRVVIEDVAVIDCGSGAAVIDHRARVRVERFEARGCAGTGLEINASPGGYFELNLERVMIAECGGVGADVDISEVTGASMRMNDSRFDSNGSHGLHVHGTTSFNNCTVAHEMGHNFSIANAGDGVRVELDPSMQASVRVTDSTIQGNAGDGVRLKDVDDCIFCNDGVWDSGGHGLVWESAGDLGVAASSIGGNQGDGLHATDCRSVTVRSTSLSSNGQFGARVHMCANGTHFKEVTIDVNGTPGGGGTVPSGGGILADTVGSITLDDTVLDGNQNDGLLVTGGSPTIVCRKCTAKSHPTRGLAIETGTGSITECDLIANAGFGIETGPGFVGAIEGNRCVGNGGAISVSGFGNSVVRNSGDAGPLGFISAPVPGNVVGPPVDDLSVSGSTNPHANVLR